MSEMASNPRPTAINIPGAPGVRIEQTSTRGDGRVEQGEAFERDGIDFSRVTDHLRIHTDGEVAGSQFNGELFPQPEAVVDFVKGALPERLHYDQHGRAELTLTTDDVVGYSGVKPISELEAAGLPVERGMRMPGGEPGEVEGIKGAWFPEMARNPETGRFEVAIDSEGSVKNPHGKFEPEANIVHVDKDDMASALATEKMTVILQKNPESEQPTALTIFPGENAPAFPAKIQSATYQADTLQTGPEAKYWAEHAFIQAAR
ncbi:MAG TPA: hypothetical protein VLA88_02990 [Candidatus Saccharimonadales bacterium]|nr:hypothetical protein [Candidatus Saccharimonadales bacterium]